MTGLNIDEIAKLLSSNVCENYFSCLTKYTQGKRINVDFTDTWRVQQAFVAGIISDSNFLSDLMDKVGVQESVLRNERLSTLSSRKDYQKKYHATDKQKKRRSLATQIRNHNLGKIEANVNRHKTDKVKPGETVDTFRIKSKPKKKKTRKRKCSRCGETTHNTNDCILPSTEKRTKVDHAIENLVNDLF